jgi:hypothetical protein
LKAGVWGALSNGKVEFSRTLNSISLSCSGFAVTEEWREWDIRWNASSFSASPSSALLNENIVDELRWNASSFSASPSSALLNENIRDERRWGISKCTSIWISCAQSPWRACDYTYHGFSCHFALQVLLIIIIFISAQKGVNERQKRALGCNEKDANDNDLDEQSRGIIGGEI